MTASYKIIRRHFNSAHDRVIKTNLTLAEARAHCKDPETSSTTCKNETANEEGNGPWFDSFDEE